MIDISSLILPFVFGVAVGSFLNVCIYRIPSGISIVSPPSRCPACLKHIAFYDNIPIISYIVLMGRCRRCKSPVSARYPAVEAVTGLFAAALFLRFALTTEFFIYFAFVSAMIVITFIDVDHQIIPDVISLPGIPLGLVASFFLPSVGVADSLIGTVSGGGLLFGIAAAYYYLTGKEGMGGGDIKLLAMIGAFT
ncbi:MAG: prepilin peptidase, partial [Deltaproteobacteria bacterium]